MLCPTILTGGIYEDWFDDLENEGYLIKKEHSYEILNTWVLRTTKQSSRNSNIEDNKSWENVLTWMLKKSNLFFD
jgi:hypothetical protein